MLNNNLITSFSCKAQIWLTLCSPQEKKRKDGTHFQVVQFRYDCFWMIKINRQQVIIWWPHLMGGAVSTAYWPTIRGIQIWSKTSCSVSPCGSPLSRSRSPQDQNGRRSGVLALPLSVPYMGWVLGPIALIACAYITYYPDVLLFDCYRSPEPVQGKRNYICTWTPEPVHGKRNYICTSTPSAPVSVTNNPQINFSWQVWMDIGSMHACISVVRQTKCATFLIMSMQGLEM